MYDNMFEVVFSRPLVSPRDKWISAALVLSEMTNVIDIRTRILWQQLQEFQHEYYIEHLEIIRPLSELTVCQSKLLIQSANQAENYSDDTWCLIYNNSQQIET